MVKSLGTQTCWDVGMAQLLGQPSGLSQQDVVWEGRAKE